MALQHVQEWLGDLPGCPGVVGRSYQMSRTHSRMSGSSQKPLRDLWEWSRCPPGCQGVVGRPSLFCRSGRESLPDVRVALSDIR